MKKGTKIILAGALCFCMLSGANAFFEENSQAKNEGVVDCSYTALAAPSGTEVYDTIPLLDIEDIRGEDMALGNDDGYEASKESTLENQKSENAEGGEYTKKNGFEEIYKLAIDNVSEILSLAAFIGSLICAIIYKSGLMPLMENGLKGLKNATVTIKEATDKAESESKKSMNTMTQCMEALESSVEDMCRSFLSLSNSLSGYKNQLSHQKRLDTILEGELDMLYDIFMTSALPEYEKARVGERMTKLREVLNSGENEE